MAFVLLYWKYFLAAAVIAALVLFYNIHVNGLIKDAETKAVTERDASWRASEQAAIAKANALAQAQEAAHAKDLETIGAQHQKDLANAKIQHDKDVAAARSGALSLRIPSNCPGSGNVSGPSAPAAGNHDTATTELPRQITGDLFSLANDADALARQLAACQAVVLSDRKGIQ